MIYFLDRLVIREVSLTIINLKHNEFERKLSTCQAILSSYFPEMEGLKIMKFAYYVEATQFAVLGVKRGRKEQLKMIRHLITAFTICSILASGIVFAGSEARENAAIASAESWLMLVDDGRYAESWKEAAEYFKAAVNQDQWEQSMLAVRQPLGQTLSRKLKDKKYKTSLPGAPDGEYVVIQFEASFENKKSAIETITPLMEKDGKWRVSGYYIK